IADELHFDYQDMSTILSVNFVAYGCGQIINGLLTDRIGGKRAMLIGAAGIVVVNVLFGFASFWGMLSWFLLIRGIDGYLQSFGAPGMVKINAAWFAKTERGRFAGIFGFMINAGRLIINTFGPALLAGFVFLGLWYVPPLHWRWLFWIPAGLCTVVAIAMAFISKETPQAAGFPPVDEDHIRGDETHAPVSVVFKAIASNPVIWIIALAYACTGAVRQGIDQWFFRFMQEVHHFDLGDVRFKYLGIMIPLVGSLSSVILGYISDLVFNGR